MIIWKLQMIKAITLLVIVVKVLERKYLSVAKKLW